jgi:2-oxoglutarate dehydrogenase complex dehydrogenase (E1) component-like enzyme
VADTLDPSAVSRVLLCTGKLAHELMDARDAQGSSVAVVRIEQLYPWPEAELAQVLARYPQARDVRWVQEEPGNMGAWGFVHGRLLRILQSRGIELRHIARAASASPATGSTKVHEREQAELLAAALG